MKTRLLLLCSVLGLAAVGVALATRSSGSAVADDTYRTTSLSLNTFDFDDDGTAEDAITAVFSTSLSTDARVRIDTYWRAPNQQEKEGGSTWADRADGNQLWTRWRYPRDEFNSGTVFRAVFTASNSGGTTFTYERTVTIP